MQKTFSGFSLIELLIAMAVIGIGLVITVPTMRDFTSSNQQTEEINKLVRDITFAKSEAITRGTTVTISQLGSTDGDWYDGWEVKSGATVIRTNPALTTAQNNLLETSGHTSISFKAYGTTTAFIGTTSDTNAIIFELCDSGSAVGETDKQINVSVTGHISLDSKFDC